MKKLQHLKKKTLPLKAESEKYLAEKNKLKADLESFTDDVDMTKFQSISRNFLKSKIFVKNLLLLRTMTTS